MGILLAGLVAAATAAPQPLDYRFDVTRADGAIYNPWILKDDKVELRSFIGSGEKAGDFVGPTIRVAPGQRLSVTLDNRLAPCSDAQRKEHSASTTPTCTRTGFGSRRPGTATMCWSRSTRERRTGTNIKFPPTIRPEPIGTIRISTAPDSSRSEAAWRGR